MKFQPALTLIELIVVLGIIAVVSGTSFIAIKHYRERQALDSSVEKVKVVASRAKIFSRENKDEKFWGVRILGATTYQLLSKNSTDITIESESQLDAPCTFNGGDVTVWFEPGSGATNNPVSIPLVSGGYSNQINISAEGLISS